MADSALVTAPTRSELMTTSDAKAVEGMAGWQPLGRRIRSCVTTTRTCGFGPFLYGRIPDKSSRFVQQTLTAKSTSTCLAVRRYVPHGHWNTTTFLAALRCTGLTAPLVIDGGINGAMFLTWVKKELAPTLQPEDIVIMDNLSSHKVKGVHETIEAVGARVLFLPP